MPPAASPYSRLSVTLHWATLLLLVATYATIQLRELWPRGSDPREAMKALHFSLGLTIWLVVCIRLVARWLHSRHLPAPANWPARVVHVLLYIFLFGTPLLGWAALSAGGDPVLLFGLNIPPLTGADPHLAERLKSAHETVGELGYWLVGLHSAAALLHHFILRDKVMLRMAWPAGCG